MNVLVKSSWQRVSGGKPPPFFSLFVEVTVNSGGRVVGVIDGPFGSIEDAE